MILAVDGDWVEIGREERWEMRWALSMAVEFGFQVGGCTDR